MSKMQIKTTMRCYHTFIIVAKIGEKLTMPHTNEDSEQLELSYTADGNAAWHVHPGKRFGSFLSS